VVINGGLKKHTKRKEDSRVCLLQRTWALLVLWKTVNATISARH